MKRSIMLLGCLCLAACQPTPQTPSTPTVRPMAATSIPMTTPAPQAGVPEVTTTPALPPGTLIPIPMPRQATPAVDTSTPTLYLEEAFGYIQISTLKREGVDWASLKQEATTLARDAKTTADTYPAIRRVLERLGDKQASLLSPDQVKAETSQRGGLGLVAVHPARTVAIVVPNSPADKAGVNVGDVIETINGAPAMVLDAAGLTSALRQAPLRLGLKRGGQTVEVSLQAAMFDLNRPPVVKRLGQVGYVDLPDLAVGGPMLVMYPNLVQRGLRDVDQDGTCGWIVDLRRTPGGNQWPLLAGIGPVLGEGEVGAFVGPARKVVWAYREGQAQTGIQAVVRAENPYQLQQATPPVAILTSGLTANAGEATLIAFKGRPQTRVFGEPTAGQTAATASLTLSDGAQLTVTTAQMADRSGQTYADRIAPDQVVTIDWATIGSENDPVIQAARAWLKAEQGCG